MTKKHFIAIAAIFAARPWTATDTETKAIAFDMADYFGTINPNFDRARFLAAANVYNESE